MNGSRSKRSARQSAERSEREPGPKLDPARRGRRRRLAEERRGFDAAEIQRVRVVEHVESLGVQLDRVPFAGVASHHVAEYVRVGSRANDADLRAATGGGGSAESHLP